jgi:CHAT domain-containing protein/Flp pilus assembly protein TadD
LSQSLSPLAMPNSLTLAQSVDERKAEGDRLLDRGFVLLKNSQVEQALTSWNQAAQSYQQAGDEKGSLKALNNIAYFIVIAGLSASNTQSITLYQQAISRFQEIGNIEGQVQVLNYLGSSYFTLGQYRQAIEVWDRALTLARQIDYRQGQAIALSGLGSSYLALHNLPAAIKYLQPSLSLFERIRNISIQFQAHNNLALAYNRSNQYNQALDVLQQLQSRLEEVELKSGGVEVESIILFTSNGTEPLELSRTVNLTGITINMFNILGQAYVFTGQYPKAVTVLQEALSLSRTHKYRREEADSLGNLGRLYYQLGRYSQAIEVLQESIAISRQTEQAQGLSLDLNTLGGVYLATGNNAKAVEVLQEALALAKQTNDTYAQISALITLGGAYVTSDAYESAVEPLQQAVAISRAANEPQSSAYALGNLGLALLRSGQYQPALDNFQQALQISRSLGEIPGQARALEHLGRAYMYLKQYPQATKSLYQAIDLLSSLRSSELNDAETISLFETQVNTYQLLEVLLVAQNQLEAALEITEQGRARAFVNLLRTRLTDASEETTPATLTLTDIRHIAQQQNATLVQYSVIDAGVGSSVLFIWAIAPSGKVAFQQVDLSSLDQPLSELVTTSRNTLGVRNRSEPATIVTELKPEAQQRQQAQQRQKLQQLHQLLIEPIAQYLPTNPDERVIFIPQGELFLVPFPALVDAQGDYLIKKHTILTAPSIQVLDLTRQQRKSIGANSGSPIQADNVLVVGNPIMPKVWNPAKGIEEQLSSLPGAEEEAVTIANAFATKPLLWEQATETTVAQQMPQARIIHLSTHGLLEYGNPQDSGVRDFPGAIALSPSSKDDGLLTSAEILKMKLKAELVVLSACDTGRGKITGDGVIGLSRSLITAGVPSVIVSLWSVPDAPTAELMSEFYRQWQQNPDKAKALRQAMLITMQNHPNPRDWAAFTLIGESE